MRPVRNISRRLSEGMVVQAIMHRGPISRASLAINTGLSKQTVSEIVSDLEEEGWVAETGRTSGSIGRTAVTYEIVPSAAHVVAVDLGAKKVKVAVADLMGAFKAEETEPTDRRGGTYVVDQIVRICGATTTALGIRQDGARLAVIGVPGVPEPDTGRVRLAPSIPGLDVINVAGHLARGLGYKVVLENDVNLATQGEAWRGAGQGVDNLVYVALGTGVGCGLIIAGELVRGADNAAGEMGFLPFGANPLDNESCRLGAFERVAASEGILRRYLSKGGKGGDVAAIFDRARDGETAALAVVEDTGQLLATGIAAVCAIVNPKKVVLGGSIGARTELIETVRAALPRYFHSPVGLEAGALGPRAALVGAVAAGLGLLHNSLFGGGLGADRIALPSGEAKVPAASSEKHRLARGVLAPASAKPGRQ